MRNKKLLLILIFLLSNYVFEAQNKIKQPSNNVFSCVTKSGESINNQYRAGSSDYLHVPTGQVNNVDYCLKVYIHKITKNDFTGGISDNDLNLQVDVLQDFFDEGGDSGIDFVWDGNILEINNDNIFDFSAFSIGGTPTNPIIDFTPLDYYSHDDGIDLFFYNGPIPIGASVSDGLANNTRILVDKGHASTQTTSSPAIAHEMGHILGLFHPFHGTIGSGSPFGENGDGYGQHAWECPGPGEIGTNSGDYIADNEPDTGYSTPNGPCSANSVNDSGQCNGANFPPPDFTNLMRPSSNFVSCASQFTPLQVRRMKWFIQTRPVLQDAIAPSCSAPACNALACSMIAEIDAIIDNENCKVSLNGINTGVYCPDQTYEWYIRPVGSSFGINPNSTEENFTHTFSTSGRYEVLFKIIFDGRIECYDDSDIKTITVSCVPPPTCPDASCLNLISPPNTYCGEVQAWMNCNDKAINSIKWSYTIGNYNHVYAGTSYGNTAGQHAYPIYLPPPPSFPGNWSGYILTVYAETYFDGTVCSEIFTRTRLSDCASGGGPLFSIDMYPNPSKSGKDLQFSGLNKKEVKTIEILDLFGNVKTIIKPKSNNFNIGKLSSGIYFVKFYTSKGIIEKKLIIK